MVNNAPGLRLSVPPEPGVRRHGPGGPAFSRAGTGGGWRAGPARPGTPEATAKCKVALRDGCSLVWSRGGESISTWPATTPSLLSRPRRGRHPPAARPVGLVISGRKFSLARGQAVRGRVRAARQGRQALRPRGSRGRPALPAGAPRLGRRSARRRRRAGGSRCRARCGSRPPRALDGPVGDVAGDHREHDGIAADRRLAAQVRDQLGQEPRRFPDGSVSSDSGVAACRWPEVLKRCHLCPFPCGHSTSYVFMRT